MQSLLISHTQRYHRQHQTGGHVWQGRFKSPVIQDDAHLLTVLRYIEANPLRARLIADLADFPWSSYPAHALGQPNPLLDALPELEALGRTPAERRARWKRKVQAPQPEAELAAVRASLQGGRPLASPEWIAAHARRLGINPSPRPRGRPRKAQA
jgi:putative transposase